MIHFTGSSDPADPTGGPSASEYSSYVKCDCCGGKSDPDTAMFDRVSGMTVCAPCQPDFRSIAEGEGDRVDFTEIDQSDIIYEERENDYEAD